VAVSSGLNGPFGRGSELRLRGQRGANRLAELQAEGQLSLTDLAARVGLTVPTHRRVRDLEQFGTITGYRAVVDPRLSVCDSKPWPSSP
jgi:hypothetical protein